MILSPRTSILALGVVFAIVAPALAETPTAAQQQAIRSNCVSDYKAHCASVPTGGMDALICLEQNESSLSPACKTAVEAVDPPASPAPAAAASTAAPAAPATKTPAPAATAATPAAPAAAPASPATEPRLTFRQEMAIAGGACAVDFRLFCPNLPVGHGNILFCLQVHEARLAPACKSALVKLGVPM